jgi:hypothetical protein
LALLDNYRYIVYCSFSMADESEPILPGAAIGGGLGITLSSVLVPIFHSISREDSTAWAELIPFMAAASLGILIAAEGFLNSEHAR